MRLSLHCFACSMTLATPQGLIAQVATLLVLCNFPDLFQVIWFQVFLRQSMDLMACERQQAESNTTIADRLNVNRHTMTFSFTPPLSSK